jgi:urease accessory protein
MPTPTSPRDRSAWRALGLFCALASVPSGGPAAAHILGGEPMSFVAGVEHPLTGIDHVVAMLAVGLWGAQLGAPAIWLLPVAFPLVMAFGGMLGLLHIPFPGTEILVGLSGFVLGQAVALEVRAPLGVAVALVAVFGLSHGYAHGAELPAGRDPTLFSLGFILATGFIHGCGIALGLLHRWRWGRVGVRMAGLAISLVGLSFLFRAVV